MLQDVSHRGQGFGYEPIYITTVEQYKREESAASYPGGGLDPSVPLVKRPLTGAFETQDGARDAVYGMMSEPRYMSGIYAGMPAATIGGNTHSLEYCGGLAWFEERGRYP